MSKQSRSILLAYNKCVELAVKFQNILDSFHHLDDGDVLVNSQVTAEKVTLTFSGNKVIEIPVGAGGTGLTDEQATALQANTDARHPHLNLSVLDMIGMDSEGRITFNNNTVDTVIAQRDVYAGYDSDDNTISAAASTIKFLKGLIDILQLELNSFKSTEFTGNTIPLYKQRTSQNNKEAVNITNFVINTNVVLGASALIWSKTSDTEPTITIAPSVTNVAEVVHNKLISWSPNVDHDIIVTVEDSNVVGKFRVAYYFAERKNEIVWEE